MRQPEVTAILCLGFVYAAGLYAQEPATTPTFTTFDAPAPARAPARTYPLSMNIAGTIAGTITDANDTITA